MNTKHSNQSSRYPLKRVRPDNENQGSNPSTNGRTNKKLRRQPSEDSAFTEIEKSSDERASDLFHKEYFSQFRPYFKNRIIVIKFIEHLWSNMIESSKVSFVKKILKEQGIYDISTSFNDSDTFSNDENDSQISKSLNESNRNISILNTDNKYTRGFLNDLLFYLKHCVTPRFIDKNSSSKMITPLRRSSRIRRAPVKCVCSTCVTTGANEAHSSSTSIINNDLQHKGFRHLIDYYLQLDDEFIDIPNTSSIVDHDKQQMKSNETNDSQIQMPLSEIIESRTHVASPPPIMPMVSVDSSDGEIHLPSLTSSSLDLLIDSSNEKIPLVVSEPISISERPTRRTYVILTELDEPFFGPYPIEFTITI